MLSVLSPGTARASEPVNRPGFTVTIVAPETSVAGPAAVVAYQGPIAYPMAENLAEIVASLPPDTERLMLDLDSEGGSLAQAVAAIETLLRAASRFRLETRIGHGRKCLSSCIPIFMQGRRRIASSASVWLLHGGCGPMTNVPSEKATQTYIRLLRQGGIAVEFLSMLECAGYFTEPGALWLSGYQLFHVHKAGIITELLPDWHPERPVVPPFDPNVRAR
ncbi:MAG: hypothetical protein SFW09_17850 [Hyphomicrobiaceae bacterium]|nr:hypothetical protein [Hyphomicrobiaceae bacterium]